MKALVVLGIYLAIGIVVALVSIPAINRTPMPFPKWVSFLMIAAMWPVRVHTMLGLDKERK